MTASNAFSKLFCRSAPPPSRFPSSDAMARQDQAAARYRQRLTLDETRRIFVSSPRTVERTLEMVLEASSSTASPKIERSLWVWHPSFRLCSEDASIHQERS